MSTLAYRIQGGYPVKGTIRCLGAKNFATKAMIAALLGDTPSLLTNVPPIGDVQITEDMLTGIGVGVEKDGDTRSMRIDPTLMGKSAITTPDSGSNRMPILLLGALLHRFKEVSVPVMGGCNIGARKVDFHLDAIRRFGGRVEESPGGFVASRGDGLKGTVIELAYPSVGATETALFLAVRAEGRSVIRNAAVEPEIMALITMLRAMGAIIFTTPNREIRVEGVPTLSGTHMNILGDRIEAASWASLACASDGDIVVKGINADTMGNFLSYYQMVGGGFELLSADQIRFFRKTALRPAIIETDVYPGFSTDWQQPFAVLLTQAKGISVIHETVYENRFGYLEALNRLGAQTQLTTKCLGDHECRYKHSNHKHSALIVGPTPLKAAERLVIPDLRAGLAYVIAAAIAKGTSQIVGVEYIERGYGDIIPRLSAMNLKIERVELPE